MIGAIGEGLYELGVDEGAVDAQPRQGYGGDAANTAVMAARLGGARLCGRVGGDALGGLLLEFWRRADLDTRPVTIDDAPTGIYVNERLGDGGSRFHYHRRGSAGSRLSVDDVTDEFLDGLDALHYTGDHARNLDVGGSGGPVRRRRTRERGGLVSFAINHRPALQPDERELAAAANAADVVFASSEESEPSSAPAPRARLPVSSCSRSAPTARWRSPAVRRSGSRRRRWRASTRPAPGTRSQPCTSRSGSQGSRSSARSHEPSRPQRSRAGRSALLFPIPTRRSSMRP